MVDPGKANDVRALREEKCQKRKKKNGTLGLICDFGIWRIYSKAG